MNPVSRNDDDQQRHSTCRPKAAVPQPPLGTAEERAHVQTQASPHKEVVLTNISWLDAGSCIGRYRILQSLGHGGQGQVFLAVDTNLGRQVALKTISSISASSKEHLQRFSNEAHAVAALQHPNIVSLYEVFEERSVPFLAMEYVEGEPLNDLLASKSLSRDRLIEIVTICCEAMALAHQKGILHRDLKPHNIIIAKDGTVKVADFGLAKCVLDDARLAAETIEGQVLGSPAYMAPEQAEGRQSLIGPHTDVYALGIMLYQCLTGWLPYQAEAPMAMLMHALQDETPPPKALDPSIDTDINAICTKATSKDPKDRYPTAGEMAADLRRYRKQEPILARPIGTFTRFRKALRRNKDLAFVSAAAMVFMAVVLGSTIPLLAWQSSTGATEGFRNQLIGIANTAAIMFSEDDIQQVRALSDEQSAPFLRLVNRLNDLRRRNRHICNAYILRKVDQPPEISFVADADAFLSRQTGEGGSHAGDRYFPPEGSVVQQAFVAATANRRPAKTKLGTVLSGYAPIQRADGDVVALLGLDMSVEQMYAQKRPILRTTLQVSALGTVLFMGLSSLVVFRILRRKKRT